MTQPIDYASFGGYPRQPRIGKGLFGWVLFISLAITLVFLLRAKSASYQRIPLSEFRTQLTGGKIPELTIDGDDIYGTMQSQNGQLVSFVTEVPKGTSANWQFTQWVLDHSGGTVSVRNDRSFLSETLLPMIPWILILGFIWFFVLRPLRRMKQGFSGMVP